MGAYYGDFGAFYRVYFYNDLTKKIIYKGTKNKKEDAERLVKELNEEWESNFEINVENWARRHFYNLEKIDLIAEDCGVPQSIVRRKLKEFDTDWYNYNKANKEYHKRKQAKYRDKRLRGADKVTASVYNTFLKTMRSLGKTEGEAWIEIYKITGEEVEI